jgi:hypothetical protein
MDRRVLEPSNIPANSRGLQIFLHFVCFLQIESQTGHQLEGRPRQVCIEIIQALEKFPSKVTSPLVTLRVWASKCVINVFIFTKTQRTLARIYCWIVTMILFSNRKPFAQKFNKEYGACDLKVSDGLSVTLSIDACHCDIRETMLLLDVL